MNQSTVKSAATAIFSVITSVFGALAIPILLLVSCNVIDYITGLMAAPRRRTGISSYRGIQGIVKKVCMWILVIVGFIIDQLLHYVSQTIGLTIPFTYLVASVVAIWIICNELISILENVVDIGVPVPSFLMPLIKEIKTQVDTITKTHEEGK